MTKRKVEAWALIEKSGRTTDLHFDRGQLDPAYGESIVHLVERDPAAEAVMRAATKHYKDHGSRTHSNDCDVCLAVERYQKSRRK